MFFFFYKIGEQEGRIGSAQTEWRRLAPWEWGGVRERGRRMNMVEIMYTHVYRHKNDTC
jgi:hypothetical protein